MSDWYVSSAVYATIPVWAATTAYTVGQLVKPTAPAVNTSFVFRCTVAGTSGGTEPTWSAATANNATIVSGGATFTNVAGQSTYGWSAPAGTLNTISNQARAVAGDRVFVSSDHAESFVSSPTYNFNNSTAGFGLIQIISVNRAGSVPPTASDVQSGAAITNPTASSNIFLEAYCNLFFQGLTFTLSGASGAINLYFNSAAAARKSFYLKNCAIALTSVSASGRITSNNVAKVTLDNTTIQFGNVAQAISSTAPFDFNWINTLSAIVGATIPTILFSSTAQTLLVTCRGVDLSAVTGTLLNSATASEITKVLLDSCRIASDVTRYAMTSTTAAPAHDEIELVNCFDGTNIINERYTPAGSVTTDISTALSSGAQDDVGNYSLKLVSSTRADFQTMPLDAFWLDVENVATGAAKTATIEVDSFVPLNNIDIRLQLEHMSVSGSSLSSFVENLASVLTPAAALPSSFNTWNGFTIPATTFDGTPSAGVVMSNGNLTVTHGTTGNGTGVFSTFALLVGKYYFEVTLATAPVVNAQTAGILLPGTSFLNMISDTNTTAVHVGTTHTYVGSNNVSQLKDLGTTAVGDVFGFAIDLTSRLAWIRRNGGNWNGDAAANPATGVGGVTIASGSFAPAVAFANTSATDAFTANFGATTFAFTAPSGFVGWAYAQNKHLLQATFTPQTAGRVRGLVRLGKTSTTVWVNPQIVVT